MSYSDASLPSWAQLVDCEDVGKLRAYNSNRNIHCEYIYEDRHRYHHVLGDDLSISCDNYGKYGYDPEVCIFCYAGKEGIDKKTALEVYWREYYTKKGEIPKAKEQMEMYRQGI